MVAEARAGQMLLLLLLAAAAAQAPLRAQFCPPVMVLELNGSANTGGDPGLQPDRFFALDAAGQHLFGSAQSAHHPWHSSDAGDSWQLGGENSVGAVISSRGGAFYGLTRTNSQGSAHTLGLGPPGWLAEKGVNLGCDATSTHYCPGLPCDLKHSPVVLEISVNTSNGALIMTDSCREVSHTLPPRLLNRSIGLYNRRGAQPTNAVQLADGSFVMVLPVQLAGSGSVGAVPGIAHLNDPTLPYPLPDLAGGVHKRGRLRLELCIHHRQQGQPPWSFYGPTEHDISLLADNMTLVVVMRPDADSRCGSRIKPGVSTSCDCPLTAVPFWFRDHAQLPGRAEASVVPPVKQQRRRPALDHPSPYHRRRLRPPEAAAPARRAAVAVGRAPVQ